jgi:putative membrane protein
MGKVKRLRERSIVKGALAGLAGGIAGSGAKILAERMYPPVSGELTSSPLESAVDLETAVRPWVLGAVIGAAYGAVIELEPKAGVWRGAGFGLAIRKLAHQVISPQARAGEVTVRQRTQQRQSEWVSYAVFGVATEAVRRLVRRGL